MSAQTHYGPDAQLDRDFESLTQKQRNTVEAILKLGPEATGQEIADEAGVNESYTHYVRDHFPHIIDSRRTNRKLAADGGSYQVALTPDQAWKAIRLLPEELSETIFRQVRGQ